MRLLAFFPGFFLVSLPFFTYDQVSFPKGHTIFFEDFETGDPLPEGWTVTGFPYILWHIAEDGECLAQTRMAAYNNGPASCDYTTGTTTEGRIKSTPFFMTGEPPFFLSFLTIRQVDPGVDEACVWIVDVETGGTDVIGCVDDNSGELLVVFADIPNSPFWAGREVRIEFEFTADQVGNDNPGWFVDNVEVRNSSEPPVPTISEWGLIILALLLLTSGTLVHRHRRRAFFPGLFLVSLPFFAFNQVSFAQGQTVFFEDFEAGDPLEDG